MSQIRRGLVNKLDVSLYADSNYTDFQMMQIRLGLEKSLDVSVYANIKYDWKQMQEIREGLLREKENLERQEKRCKGDFKYLEAISSKRSLNQLLLNTREHYSADVEKTTFEIMNILSSKKLPIIVVDLIVSRLGELVQNSKILATLETLETK